MSASISARLGTDCSISNGHQQIADEDRASADEAQWIADAELEDARHILRPIPKPSGLVAGEVGPTVFSTPTHNDEWSRQAAMRMVVGCA